MEAVLSPTGEEVFASDTEMRLFWMSSETFLIKYPGLFTLDDARVDRNGDPLPPTWSFNCPDPCDEYTCEKVGAFPCG